MALDAPADSLQLGRRRVRVELDPARRSRRSPTWRCTRTGPARSRRGSRAASMRRRCTATRTRMLPSISTLTSSATLSVPNSAVYGLMPQSVCLTSPSPVSRPSSVASVERRPAPCVRTARARRCTSRTAVGARRDTRRAELDRGPLEHVVVDRLADAVLVLRAERLDAARALEHLQRSRVGGERQLGVARVLRPPRPSRSTSVTSITRSCPALAAPPVRPRADQELGIVRTQRVRTRLHRHPFGSD